MTCSSAHAEPQHADSATVKRRVMRFAWTVAMLVFLLLPFQSVNADIVLYTIPRTKLTFLLEGRTQANPGKTLTLRHAKGTVHLGLDDVTVFKVDSPRSIASNKIAMAKSKQDVHVCIEAARWSLHNGQLDKFYEALSVAWKIDNSNPTVKRLAAMRQRMSVALPQPAREKADLTKFAAGRKMKFAYSKHFILMHDTEDVRPGRTRSAKNRTRAEQRLVLLETVYESFLMKFALEGYELTVPREYLKVVLFSEHEDYLTFVRRLSPGLQSTAGFYHREKNISVFYDQGTHARYDGLAELNDALQEKRDEAVRQRRPSAKDLVRFADTLQMLIELSRTNEDVEVVSHEATHHMAGNTGLMPASAPVPVWAAEGLATYFESPKEAAWSGIGAVNEQRLDWYRQLARDTRHSNIEFIVSDRIFSLARTSEGRLHGYAQAWALTHFLMEHHFDKFMKWYGVIAARQQKEQLSPEQLMSSFRFVFGNDLGPLESQWRSYMRTLKTDIEKVVGER